MAPVRLLSLFLLAFGFALLWDEAHAAMLGPSISNSTFDAGTYQVSYRTLPSMLLTGKFPDGSLTNVTQYWKVLQLYEAKKNTTNGKYEPVPKTFVDMLDPSITYSEKYFIEENSQTGARISENYNFSTILPNNATFVITMSYFKNEHSVFYPQINHTQVIFAESFKFSVFLSDWPFADESEVFVIEVNATAYPFFDLSTNASFSKFVATDRRHWGYLNGPSELLFTHYLNLNLFSFVDSKLIFHKWESVPIEPFLDPSLGPVAKTFNHKFFFPRFNESLVYDPDLSILSNAKDEGNNGSSGDDLILVKILVPLFVVGALVLLLVVMGVAVGIMFYAKYKRRHSRDSVNF